LSLWPSIGQDIWHIAVFYVNYSIRNEFNAGTDLGGQVTLVWIISIGLGSIILSVKVFLIIAHGDKPKEDIVIIPTRLLNIPSQFIDDRARSGELSWFTMV